LIEKYNTAVISTFSALSLRLKKDLHLKELLAGSSVAFVLRITGMLFSYVWILLITRNFGADAMGIFALSTTVLSVFSILGKLGLDMALLRFVSEYSAQGRHDLVKEVYIKALKIIIPLSLFLALLLFFLSPYIANNIFHREYLSYYFRIVSLGVLPMVLININSQALRGLKKIKEFSFFQNISNPMFAGIALLTLLVFTKEQSAPLISYVTALLLGASVSYILWQRNIKADKNQHEKSVRLRDMLNVSVPMLLSSSMSFIIEWTAIIMLGMFRSNVEVGIFNVAVKISLITTVSLMAINSIAAPKFAEFYGKSDMAGLGRIARQSSKLIFWTSFPVLLIIFVSPSFILGVFGEDFKAGVLALILLTIGQFINAVSGSVGFILNMTGRQKVFQNIILITTMLNILLNLILIPAYGINGAAFANMVTMVFWNLCSVIYIKRYLKIDTIYIPILIRRLLLRQDN
jgi:O-antigen/teichoic acid export membrane protein